MSLDKKMRSSVQRENILKEKILKENILRLQWSNNWQWYIDLLREREKVIAKYKKSSPKALAMGPVEEPDNRTVLPFPNTTAREYGWLASKKEFQLEVYGSYYENLKTISNSPDASSSIFYTTSEL